MENMTQLVVELALLSFDIVELPVGRERTVNEMNNAIAILAATRHLSQEMLHQMNARVGFVSRAYFPKDDRILDCKSNSPNDSVLILLVDVFAVYRALLRSRRDVLALRHSRRNGRKGS